MDLEKAISELISSTINAKDFILAEMPEYIQQLLMWKMSQGIFYAITGIFILYLAFLLSKKIMKQVDDMIMATMVCTAPVLAGLILFFENITTVIQILVAPKVYLVEYAASLIK